ncbi:WD40/YVTN/BNR-like repeat-containing protein [Halalkalicoccus jeotgali]|uniref:Glycosyl hydrolase n=1 Tax=Halalkalicoccus jeotgali (strain DSM 18796 / CECT 7217 / JCM 14584 / KCTC 4019 / B3) TaxID=795797 RepID=D8J7S6_HALJB|nr:hypothetical protein [Halalkalicoccus jeotgali]ADJ16096.1 hypothetical protein HacjB3_13575 [Halalkalicoccus jeotgali B3]ELY38191.1 hypothetical protein C497_08784 [Halalkalicoccus jeotgali B3]
MNTVYTAMRNTLIVARAGSGDWALTHRLGGRDLQCLAVSPEADERVFVGTAEDGLLRSADGGESFERVGRSIGSDRVMSATVSPHDPAEVWVGTEPSAVYRSRDAGDSWEHMEGIVDLPSEPEWYFPPRPDTHHVRWIEIDPHDPRRIYVGIELGALLISDDGGETWRERPPGSRRDNHSLATHPDESGSVYSAAGDGYAESHDGGESWTHPQEGLDHRYCWSVRPDPTDPDTVLVSCASGARSAHSVGSAESYVYRRRGRRWDRLAGRGLPMGEGVLRATLATHGEEFYAATNRGLFRSRDAGDSWDRLPVEWTPEFERQAPRGLTVV